MSRGRGYRNSSETLETIPRVAAPVLMATSSVRSGLPRILASLGLLVAVLILLPALLSFCGERLDPYTMSSAHSFAEPGSEFLLGGDSFGRNMTARVVAASGLTLQAIAVAVATALFLGVAIGALAGWHHGRWPDHCISWIIGLIYTVPFYLIAIAVAAVVRPELTGAFFILGLLAWAVPARLVRAEMIQLRQSLYVTALRASGFSETFILWRVLLPLSIAPAIVAIAFFVPELIGVEIGLSFFGLGAQPPTPSLGRELYGGLSHLGSAPWLVWIPAATILAIVLSFFFVGRALGKTLPSRTERR